MFGGLDPVGIVREARIHAQGRPLPVPPSGLPAQRGQLGPSFVNKKRCKMAKERVERDEEDLVRLYLTDIGQYPLLTKDDEVRLAQAIEAGNTAREELEAAGKDLTAARKRELRRL